MRLFRIRYVIKAFSLVTGVIFLNMSFILAEISALKIAQDKQTAANLSVLVASSLTEEEPGTGADEDSTSTSEVDLIVNQGAPACSIKASPDIQFNFWSHGHPRLGEFEINSPPPEA